MAKTGNVGLHDRYREAWRRIQNSIEAGHCFEAIAIEESIISDRLTSFLYGVSAVTREEAAGVAVKGKPPYLAFNTLIKRWRTRIKTDDRWEACHKLIEDVDQWRDKRNKALHALAKSFPGEEPEMSTESFVAMAVDTARMGSDLTREVLKWHKRQLTRARRLGLLPKPK